MVIYSTDGHFYSPAINEYTIALPYKETDVRLNVSSDRTETSLVLTDTGLGKP